MHQKIHASLGANVANLHDTIHSQASPVFVLSTGRCGSRLLTKILEQDANKWVDHHPNPELTYYSNYAYKNRTSQQILDPLIDACRYETIRNAFLLKQQYIETNNRITFFSHSLSRLYPHSKFVHLERDVKEFVASGYSRNWYAYEKLFDEGRIVPTNENIPWNKFNQVEKITWLWAETNGFIRDFFKEVSSERKFYISSSDLFSNSESIEQLLKFIGGTHPDRKQIERMISKPDNAQPKNRRKTLNSIQLDQIQKVLEQYF